MTGLLLIAHAPLASALRSAALHAFPDASAALGAFDVLPDATVEFTLTGAATALAALGTADTLILTDVFGATPCNVAQRLGDGTQVRVIAGVNVPMLWRSLSYAKEPLEAVVMRAMAGATQGIMQVATSKPQNQTIKPGGNDQDKHHHQQ